MNVKVDNVKVPKPQKLPLQIHMYASNSYSVTGSTA